MGLWKQKKSNENVNKYCLRKITLIFYCLTCKYSMPGLSVYKPDLLPGNIFHLSTVINPCWHSQIMSGHFVTCCFPTHLPQCYALVRGNPLPPTPQHFLSSSPTHCCHCPYCPLYSTQKVFQRRDGHRKKRKGSIEKMCVEIRHWKGKNQIKQGEGEHFFWLFNQNTDIVKGKKLFPSRLFPYISERNEIIVSESSFLSLAHMMKS